MSVTKEELEKYNKAYMEGNPIISDFEYDNLQEEYVREHGESSRLYSRKEQTDTIGKLVCTLPKVYGVTSTMRAKQKSYVDWVNKIDTKDCIEDLKIIVQPKFDGCSIAYDSKEDRYFKRGDYDNGESEEVTNVFRGTWFPDKSHVQNMCDGCKFEMIIGNKVYEEAFKEYKSPRDAAVAYMREAQHTDGYDSKSSHLVLSLIPLREIIDDKQYVSSFLSDLSLKTYLHDYEGIQSFIDELLSNGASVKVTMNPASDITRTQQFACDGVVISVLNKDDSIMDEVAIKILHDVHEAKLLDIEYQLGNTGKITPVVKITPTTFADGTRTVTSITLSTLERVDSMTLRHNDTVRVMYNIVPYLIDSKHDGDYPFNIPDKCPICGYKIDTSHLETVRCTNPDCIGRKIGNITRYCISMRMLGIAEATISKLYNSGKVTCISDLYKLTKEDIIDVEGYKDKSAENIINIIWNSATNVPVSRWLGAFPAIDISSKKWDILLNQLIGNDEMKKSNIIRDYIENHTAEEFISFLFGHSYIGIGDSTIIRMQKCILDNFDEMREIIKNISFKSTTSVSNNSINTYVTFTGCRDNELSEWLLSKCVGTVDFGSKTKFLIVPNESYQNKKTQIANNKGIPIIPIDKVKYTFELNDTMEGVQIVQF